MTERKEQDHIHEWINGVCACGTTRREMFGTAPIYGPCPQCGGAGNPNFYRTSWSTVKCKTCGHERGVQ